MVLNFRYKFILLQKYNISIPPCDVFPDEQEAFDYVKKIGFPVALKIIGENILHRTELKGVALNIDNESLFREEFKRLKNISESILVQTMANHGPQVIIGAKRDEQFGPIVMFGLGGIFVEVLKDVSFRLCPITADEAFDMIQEIK